MRPTATAGTLIWALTLGACASQQPPAAPPLKVVTEAAPKSGTAPTTSTGDDLLAHQPPAVQEAVRVHQQSGKWPVHKTAQLVLYPYGEEPEPVVDCGPLRTTDIQLETGETITDVALGRHRALDGDAGCLRRSAQPSSSSCGQAASTRDRNQPDDLHHQAHLSPASALAWAPDAGGGVLLPR